MPKQNLTGRKLPRRRRLLDTRGSGSQGSASGADGQLPNDPDYSAGGNASNFGKKAGGARGKNGGAGASYNGDDLLNDSGLGSDQDLFERTINEDVFYKRFPERLAYICTQVEQEMKEEEDPNAWSTRAWTYWFYF